MERVQTLLVQFLIRCQPTTPTSIIFSKFDAHPFRLCTIFDLVWLLHRLQGFVDSINGKCCYSYLAYCSSTLIVASNLTSRVCCWYAQESRLLNTIGIDIDHLPPFHYSLDMPTHLLPSHSELNEITRMDIYRKYIQVRSFGVLCPRMAFYAQYFIDI